MVFLFEFLMQNFKSMFNNIIAKYLIVIIAKLIYIFLFIRIFYLIIYKILLKSNFFKFFNKLCLLFLFNQGLIFLL